MVIHFFAEICNIPIYYKPGVFISYQDFTSSALSAETVAIMAHNKGLELGADMVLLLEGGLHRNNAVTLLELLLLKVSNCCRRLRHAEWSPARLPYGKPVIS